MQCIVCGNKQRFHPFLAAGKRHPNYWRCQECNLVFAHPLPDISYDHYSFSPLDPAEIESRLLNYEIRYRLFEHWLPKESCLALDVGSYTGLFLYFMKLKGIHASGIEACADAASYGAKLFNVDIASGSFEEFSSKFKYDVITMFNVFEHLKDPLSSLIRTNSLLKQNGILVMEIPNIHHKMCLWSFGRWHHFAQGHNWFFDILNMKTLLDKFGYKVEHISFISKIVTIAKIFDICMNMSGVYSKVSKVRYLRLRSKTLYKLMNSIYVYINSKDYLIVVARKV